MYARRMKNWRSQQREEYGSKTENVAATMKTSDSGIVRMIDQAVAAPVLHRSTFK